MSLCDVVDLFEYWRREWEAQHQANQDASRNTGQGYDVRDARRPAWSEPTEEQAEAQMMTLPRGQTADGVPSFEQNISRMSEDQRDLVRWCEDMKKNKLKIN